MAGNDNIEKMLRAAVDKKNSERLNAERASMIQTIGRDIVSALTPVLKAIAERPLPIGEIASAIREGVVNGMRGSQKDPVINLPDIHIPEIKLPTINVPPPQVKITIPDIKIPEIKIPDLNNIMGALRITGWDKELMNHPIPVQLRDADGKPVFLGGGGSTPIFGGSMGGGGNFPMQVLDIPNNALRVSGSFSVTSSNASSQIIDSSGNAVGSAANPLNVAIVSGSSATSATNIVDSSGVAYSGSNPVPVVFGASATQAVNMVDSSGIAYSGSNPAPITGTVLVSDISASVKTALTDSSGVQYSGSNPVPVTIISGALTSQKSQVGNSDGDFTQANPMPTILVTSATATVNTAMIDSGGVQYSGSNPVPVNLVSQSLASSASALVDSSGIQYSGSNPVPITGTVLVSDVTASVKTALIDSSGVQYSGSNPVPTTLAVSNATATVNTVLTDSGGVGYNGSNPIPITIITSATATVNAVITDSGGVGYNGANPIPITIISGALTSSLSVGDSAARVADNGGNPVKVGGIARTTNPTAYADGDRANFATDKLGRQITRPYQVRDLIKTAYVALATGTEATLLTASAGTFLDLVMITASNNSTAATQLDIRAGTAGNIIHTMYLPASSGPIGWAPSVPWPQDATGNAWTVDMPDQTGTTVYVSALFTQEI